MHEVYSFNTIEDFWRMYHNIYSVEEIMPNTDYMLFKKGIRPEWEDPHNRAGGKWVVTLPYPSRRTWRKSAGKPG